MPSRKVDLCSDDSAQRIQEILMNSRREFLIATGPGFQVAVRNRQQDHLQGVACRLADDR